MIAKLTPMLDVAITSKQMTADQKAETLKRLQTGPIPYWSKHSPKKAPVPTSAATA